MNTFRKLALPAIALVLLSSGAHGAAAYYQPVQSLSALTALGAASQSVLHADVLKVGKYDWYSASLPSIFAPQNAACPGTTDGKYFVAATGVATTSCWVFQPTVQNQSIYKLSQYAQPATETDALNLDSLASGAGKPWVCDEPYTITGTPTYSAQVIWAPGCKITRTTHTPTFSGGLDAPDRVCIFDRTGTGLVTINQGRISFGWFCPVQDSIYTAITTDNYIAWQQAVATAQAVASTVSPVTLAIPSINTADKVYGVSQGATSTGFINIIQEEGAFLYTGSGYFLTRSGNGDNTIALRVYGTSSATGMIDFDTSVGHTRIQGLCYNFTAGTCYSFHANGVSQTTFNFVFDHVWARDAFRYMKDFTTGTQSANAITILGGLWQHTAIAADTAGLFQFDRGNGIQFLDQPLIEGGGSTPGIMIGLCNGSHAADDTTVTDFQFNSAYIEGSFTYLINGGSGCPVPATIGLRNISTQFSSYTGAVVSGSVVALQNASGFDLHMDGISNPTDGSGNLFSIGTGIGGESSSGGTIYVENDPNSSTCLPGTVASNVTYLSIYTARCGISVDNGVTFANGPTVSGTFTDQSGAGLTFPTGSYLYKIVDGQEKIWAYFTFPTNSDSNTSLLGGLPFNAVNNNNIKSSCVPQVAVGLAGGFSIFAQPASNTLQIADGNGSRYANITLTGKTLGFQCSIPIK